MSVTDFTNLCECVARTGNSSHCMRLLNRPLNDLYSYLKKNPFEKQKLTIARSFFHDEMTAKIHDLAFTGIPTIRRNEKGKIVMDERGKPIIDRIPDPRLMTSLLRDHSNRLARAEKDASLSQAETDQKHRLVEIHKEILDDPPPSS